MNGKIITISSAKGGTGKTCIALHLALQLGEKAPTVLLQASPYPDLALFVPIPENVHCGYFIDFENYNEDAQKSAQKLLFPYKTINATVTPSRGNHMRITETEMDRILTQLKLNHHYVVIDINESSHLKKFLLSKADTSLVVTYADPQSIHCNVQFANHRFENNTFGLVINQTSSSTPVKECAAYFNASQFFALPKVENEYWDLLTTGEPIENTGFKNAMKKITEFCM